MAKRPSRNAQRQSVQIIAGHYRHRRIDFMAVDGLRPTGARVRETLFNWLQPHIVGARCLDLFAGSGILGFEALSRGAQSVTFVEKNPAAAKQLKHNIQQLTIDNASVIGDDFRHIFSRSGNYEVIFLDPPYALRLLPQLLDAVKIFSAKFIFIEDNQPFEDWISERNDYHIHKSKKAGNIYYGLLSPAAA